MEAKKQQVLQRERRFTVPPFAQECLLEAVETWGASFEHPFVKALAEGTLDAERFKFYQMQDARYLEAFADTCSLISTRCPDPADKEWFIEAGRLALVVERQLHQEYGRKLGYTAEDIARLVPTPNNLAYQNHMLATAMRGTLVEAVAALTPCPWLYVELGHYLEKELGGIPDDHPYADWLRTYADPAFDEYMENLLSRLQRYAEAHDEEARQRAKLAFKISTCYEWMFWQQAWEMQQWPCPGF